MNPETQTKKRNPSITKIVLTGGPCAGKTTAMSWIQNAFTARGYKVLFVPETATELITGGVAPWTCGTNLDYQCCQMRLQREKEAIFIKAAKSMPDERILIVCDRGMMDNKVYMTDEEFETVLDYIGQSEVAIRDHYDAVFHLVTAANGAPDVYMKNKENNPARIEDVDKAVSMDNKFIAAWTGHPHLRIIDNSTGFDYKMMRLITEIARLLGEPEPCDCERKYLIEYPDLALLESLPDCKKVEISQTYLKTNPNEEIRIRRRGTGDSCIYFKTTKKWLSPTARVEIENRLSQEDFLMLTMEADPDLRPINKTRYCLTWQGHYYEIDIYPFWKDRAILEIDIPNKDEEVPIPSFLKVTQEVTGDENYKIISLARMKLD